MSLFGTVTLPSTGVDVADYLTLGITAMGAVALVAVGGNIAFKIVRRSLGWANKAF